MRTKPADDFTCSSLAISISRREQQRTPYKAPPDQQIVHIHPAHFNTFRSPSPKPLRMQTKSADDCTCSSLSISSRRRPKCAPKPQPYTTNLQGKSQNDAWPNPTPTSSPSPKKQRPCLQLHITSEYTRSPLYATTANQTAQHLQCEPKPLPSTTILSGKPKIDEWPNPAPTRPRSPAEITPSLQLHTTAETTCGSIYTITGNRTSLHLQCTPKPLPSTTILSGNPQTDAWPNPVPTRSPSPEEK